MPWDSLVYLRTEEYIKHVSNYAVNSPFERDSSSTGLTRLRRDAIAYIDVKLSGAGDASAGQDPAAGMSAAWAAARAANGTEDEDGEKDKFGRDARGARKSSREVGKIESDSEKEEKAKFASRKSGTRIAEVEKRPVVARLKADEAEWKKRDVHTRHETATLEIGKAVAWHYAPVGKPGELWSVRKSTSASGRPGGIIYYSGRLDAARECLASSHEAS